MGLVKYVKYKVREFCCQKNQDGELKSINHQFYKFQNFSTSINKKKEKYSKNLNEKIKGLKIGIPKEYRVENMPKEIDSLWKKGIDILKNL